MILFIIIAILAITACMPSGKREKPKAKTIKPAAYKPDPQYRQLQAEIKLRQQQRREAEKEYQQRIKTAAQAEKKRQQKEQAESDMIFYENQLETMNNLLSDIEYKINRIDFDIEIDKKTRSLDKMQFHQRQKEQLLKKQMQYEARIHTLESKLAKCYYIINS